MRLRDVTNLPSRPAKGLVFTEKVMRTVGSSTEIVGSGSGLSRSQMVSPIETSDRPVTAQMSPAWQGLVLCFFGFGFFRCERVKEREKK